MTDILLIHPIYKGSNYYYLPIGLGYIATAAFNAGYSVKIIDMNINRSTIRDLRKEIASIKPRIIGISAFITQVGSVIDITKMVKESFPNIKVVVGGSLLNGFERYIFDVSPVDVIIKGEGEEVFPRIIPFLIENKTLPKVDGLMFREGKEIVEHSQKAIIHDINTIPMLNRDLFNNVEKYIIGYHTGYLAGLPGYRALEVLASRGCPYKCIFCINSTPTGDWRNHRIRNVDNIIYEINSLKEKYRINDIIFNAEAFTTKKKWVFELCTKLAPLKVTWTAITRADLLDDDLLEAMKYAGCRKLHFSIESADNSILRKMNKKMTIEQIDSTIEMVKRYNIPFRSSMVVGLPWETKESIAKTQQFCDSKDHIFIPHFITPYPGTALYNQMKHNIKNEKDYIFKLANHHNLSKYLINITKFEDNEFLKIVDTHTTKSIMNYYRKRIPFAPEALLYAIAKIGKKIYTRPDDFWGRHLHKLLDIAKKIDAMLPDPRLDLRQKTYKEEPQMLNKKIDQAGNVNASDTAV